MGSCSTRTVNLSKGWEENNRFAGIWGLGAGGKNSSQLTRMRRGSSLIKEMICVADSYLCHRFLSVPSAAGLGYT